MPPSEAPVRRASRRPQPAMAAASASSSALRPHSSPRSRPRPPSRSTTTQYRDDDDDLELPVVRTKALSVADSIARFHKVRIVGVHTDADDDIHSQRPHRRSQRKRSSSVSSSVSSASTRSSSVSSSSSSVSSSSSSSSVPSPFTTPTRSRAHERPKNHGAAAKQLYRQNRLSALVLHSVTPREALPSSTTQLLSSSRASSSYTEYDVVVENVRTSQIWQVARRYSRFAEFRKELSALFEAPHCHHCTAMHAKLDALHDDFPAKRLWGSNSTAVTSQRARKLQLYLEGLLALAAKSQTKQCRLVSTSFVMHVRGFLTVESTSFHGIPGGDLGHAIPSLLQELSRVNTGAVVSTTRLPLETIDEASPTASAGGRLTAMASPWEPNTIAMLEKDEDDETEDEEDESPNQGRRP